MQSHDISALLWTYSLPSHIHHCQLLYRHVHEASPPAFSSSKLAGSINPHPVDSKRKAHLWLTWSPCALFWVNLELSFQFLKVRGYTSLVKKGLFLYSSLLKQRPGLSYGYWPQCVIVSLLKMNLFPSWKSSFLILRVCDYVVGLPVHKYYRCPSWRLWRLFSPHLKKNKISAYFPILEFPKTTCAPE